MKNNYERVFAIGDIHGSLDKLKSLMDNIPYINDKDLFIFLGDYIDRGEQSLESLKYIMELSKKENIICLMGNHEQMMLDFFKNNDLNTTDVYDSIWIDNGGNVTFEQLQHDKDNIQLYLDFCKSLPCSYQYGNYFFCHGGIDIFKPLEKQTIDDLLWTRIDNMVKYDKDTIIVCGHTPTQMVMNKRNTPLQLSNNIIMCDTGSFMKNGKISCIDVLAKRFYQNKGE